MNEPRSLWECPDCHAVQPEPGSCGRCPGVARAFCDSRGFTLNLPREWAVIAGFHHWKDKDGGRWHIQIWHPLKQGFIVSARGIVR